MFPTEQRYILTVVIIASLLIAAVFGFTGIKIYNITTLKGTKHIKVANALTILSACSACVFLVSAIIYGIWSWKQPDGLAEVRNQIKPAIEKEYHVKLSCTNKNIAIYIDRDWLDPYDDSGLRRTNPLTARSLNPNNNTEYYVFIKKINDTWCLCKIDDQGNYVALNPNNTIAELKENATTSVENDEKRKDN